MQSVLKPILLIASLLFLAIGAAFMFKPDMVMELFGLGAPDNALGWSTVRGDLAGLFLSLGTAIGLGAATGNKTWIHAAMLLMGTVFIGRAVGIVTNGGDQQVYMNMGVEVVSIGLMWLFARGLD